MAPQSLLNLQFQATIRPPLHLVHRRPPSAAVNCTQDAQPVIFFIFYRCKVHTNTLQRIVCHIITRYSYLRGQRKISPPPLHLYRSCRVTLIIRPWLTARHRSVPQKGAHRHFDLTWRWNGPSRDERMRFPLYQVASDSVHIPYTTQTDR